MAVITSNGTGGGDWSSGSTWIGGVAPGAGDRAIISSGDTVYVDGTITVGDGTDSTSTYAITITGDLVWRNRSTDSAASWTFTIDGHVLLNDGGRWFVGTEDDSLFGTESVGPIPLTRTANIYFANNYHHRIYFNAVDNPDRCLEIWGTADFHSGTTPSETGETVDSAANKYSFVDSARTSDAANLWVGAWLEITAGTNLGEEREITAFDNSTGTLTWDSRHPMREECDSTTEYSITHNYQRAMLSADVSAGVGATITLDRPADYEVGDTLGIGSSADYENITERPDYTTIVSKISSTQYTCDLTYDHKISDFVIHMDRNVKFSCNTTNTSNRGYYFYTNGGNPEMRVNNAWFLDCGYSASYGAFNISALTDCPIIRNVSCKGFGDASSAIFTGWFINIPGGPKNVYEDYMLENIHGFNFGGLLNIESDPNTSFPISEQELLNFRDFTLIGCSYSSRGLIFLSNLSIVPHKIRNVWAEGRPVNSSTNLEGWGIYGGMMDVSGFKLRQLNYGLYITNGEKPALATTGTLIRNGIVERADDQSIYCVQTDMAQLLIENTNMRHSDQACLMIDRCGITNFILINNSYDASQGGLSGGLQIKGTDRAARIEEINGKYGLIEANLYGNIWVDYETNYTGSYRYVGYNNEFVTPTNPTSQWGAQPGDAHKVFTIRAASTWENRCKCLGAMSTVELNSPVVDSVASNSIALVNGGGIVEIADHATSPRTESNIKLRVVPFAALGETNINRTMPITAYAEAAQTVELSVYAIKNITQLDGFRPKMHVFGNGVYQTVEMTDAIDTWEELTISYEAVFNGTFAVWFTCANNLKYTKSATTDDAEEGEPADIGTVDVYFDEFTATVS